MPRSFNGYKVVESDASSRGAGSSDREALQTAYPGSPIHTGELTDETVYEQFRGLVIDGVVQDDGVYGRVDRDYQGGGDYDAAPNLEEVPTGGSGLPGSPYAPNIASPPEGQNPADIPAAGVEATEAARGGGGAFDGDGLASPHNSTKNISRQTVGSLMSGNSTPTD